MKLTYFKGLDTQCDCCGRFIKNAYIVEDQGLKFKTGSECIKKYLNVSDKAIKYIQDETKKYHKHIDKMNKLIKGIEENDIQLLQDTLKDRREGTEVKENAQKWIMICESRANKILEELNNKLNKANVKLIREA
jgi:hypothetical protein